MATAKEQLRRRLIAARRKLGEPVRAAEADALTSHVDDLTGSGVVCAYVPVGSEPGSVAMLDALHRAGARVLLPVAASARDGTPLPLSWGQYRPGGLVVARFGLLEPDVPHFPPTALADALLVLVPALAVDRRGVRLGRGAGFYDRSLPLRDPAARVIAVVRDDELLDEVPTEPHDVRMTHALTPGHGVVTLG